MKYSELIRSWKRAGWVVVRQSGSHLMMQHPDREGVQIVVPDHGTKEIGKGLENKIKKQAGLK